MESRTTVTNNEFQQAYDRWCKPVIHDIYSLEYENAKTKIHAAQEMLESCGLKPEIKEAIAIQTDFLEMMLGWMCDEDSWTIESYSDAVKYFSRAGGTAFSGFVRKKVLIKLHLQADADHIATVSGSRLSQLLAQVPAELIDAGLWFTIAGWAFRNRDLDILGQAFEVFLTNPSDVMGQAKWQRVNLMYQIVSGKVTRRDVKETIKSLALVPQVKEFQTVLWPACVEAGVTDDELEDQLHKRIGEVHSGVTRPQRERRTKSIRNIP